MDCTKRPPTILSLCTGYGGLEKGIERVLGECAVLAHVEIEAFAAANLVSKMETGEMAPAPVYTDVKTFTPWLFRGMVDILTGGYPCQPFSAAGKRLGGEDPRHIWPFIRGIVQYTRPRYCFFENVEGHVSLGLREVLTDLVNLGYRVENDCGEPTWGLFSAAEVGAPHQRKRVFILANSRSSEFNGVPEPEKRVKNGTSRNSGQKLGHPQGDDKRRSPFSSMHREGVEAGGSGCDELADTKRWRSKQPMQDLSKKFIHRGEKLAHTSCQGPQRARYPEQKRRGQSGPLHPDRGPVTQWPARPGEHQHQWEEPRTIVDDSQGQQSENIRQTDGESDELGFPGAVCGGRGESASQGNRQTEPGLGRTINGHSCRNDPNKFRVDRLRMCGNGVVPQAAEKAFRTLLRRIYEDL